MEHPFTLHEDNDGKFVQLSGDYYTEFGCSINELKAVFHQTGSVELIRFKNHDDTMTRFNLSSQEADAFLDSWLTFKAGRELKKRKEQERQAAVIAEARKLIAELPVEIIEQPESTPENLYWHIRSEQVKTVSYHACGADALLERVKLAVKDYERYQEEQAIHDEIKAIKESCKAISIRGQHPWRVTLEGVSYVYSGYANNPEQLLEHVKSAQAKYEQEQAKQDELIKSND